MCGIAGFSGPFGLADLERMTSALAHRGPDDQGVELIRTEISDHNVGLGHRRLSIIDVAGGHQPMWMEDGSCVITFNGEIYNHRELKRQLELRGAQFRTRSDTEVILQGWHYFGDALFNKLEGMFAIGIWDLRSHDLILVRDRWGIKPLYWALPQNDSLVFCSEIKPLLPFIGGAKLHLRALYQYLLYSWCPGPETLFQGIRQLDPGMMLRWRDREKTYKIAPYVLAPARQPRLDAEEWPKAIRDEFDRAVSDHLVSDVPVGLTLSGGLDSSSILASMISMRDNRSISAYTVGFGQLDDETPYAKLMADHAGVNHYARMVSTDRFAEDFAKINRIMEEPIAHPVLQTTFEAARFAREDVKVVLIGEGSDEIFLGYPQCRTLVPPLQYLPTTLRRQLYLDACCLMPISQDIKAMLHPAILDQELFEDVAHEFDSFFASARWPEGPQEFELKKALVSNQLMRIDKLTMAFGLEARVPFLDNRFVQLVKSLPIGAKIRNGRNKVVLREAMAGRLPAEILGRPKRGKGGTQSLLPFLGSLTNEGNALSSLVSDQVLSRRGWLRPDKVQAYLRRRDGPILRHHPIESRRRLKFTYALATLEQWAVNFIDA